MTHSHERQVGAGCGLGARGGGGEAGVEGWGAPFLSPWATARAAGWPVSTSQNLKAKEEAVEAAEAEEDAEAASLIGLALGNRHSATPTKFYWSSSLRSQIHGKDSDPPPGLVSPRPTFPVPISIHRILYRALERWPWGRPTGVPSVCVGSLRPHNNLRGSAPTSM